MAVGSLIAVLAGGIAFDVDWPSNIPSLLLAFVLATVASFGIGLVIAAVVPSARAASGVGTIVYFPMLFFAGVWTPGATMPDAARNVADFTPIGAASEAIADAWSGAWPTPLHLAVSSRLGSRRKCRGSPPLPLGVVAGRCSTHRRAGRLESIVDYDAVRGGTTSWFSPTGLLH
ncbi:MAG TPA: ABC transporter permease [Jiangellaceae bacterium]